MAEAVSHAHFFKENCKHKNVFSGNLNKTAADASRVGDGPEPGLNAGENL